MTTPFDTELVALCRHCHGRGYAFDEDGRKQTCPTCNGSGRVVRHSVGTLTVTPYQEEK